MAPGLEHLAQLQVQTFDRVGGVNHLWDFLGVSEKGRSFQLQKESELRIR
jgi:hypothetical protein